MVGVLGAVLLGIGVGTFSIWKIVRGYDSTLWFTAAMVSIAGCATFILVQ